MRILAAIATGLLAASSAHAVSFVNGSFEDGMALEGSFTQVDTDDSTSISGWTVLSEGVDLIGTYWQASDGSRSLDLSAMTSGGVAQMLTGFEVGKHYRITFDLSGNPDGGDNPKRLQMSATGGEAVVYSYTLVSENSASNMLWQTLTYDFVASGSMQMVQFRSLEYNPYGVALDNVSISLVPEPATWGLLMAGFGLVGITARRRALRKAHVA